MYSSRGEKQNVGGRVGVDEQREISTDRYDLRGTRQATVATRSDSVPPPHLAGHVERCQWRMSLPAELQAQAEHTFRY